MRKTITESQLRHIVKESVERVLNEISTERMGAAAMKAAYLADHGKDLSDIERLRRQRQADNLYKGARDRFEQEHSSPENRFRSFGHINTALGDDRDFDGLETRIGVPDKDEYAHHYNPKSREVSYSHYKRDDKGRYEGHDSGIDQYATGASNGNLRKTGKAEKDFKDLYRKSRQYKKQLEENQ